MGEEEEEEEETKKAGWGDGGEFVVLVAGVVESWSAAESYLELGSKSGWFNCSSMGSQC
jgi:hypothetical protein